MARFTSGTIPFVLKSGEGILIKSAPNTSGTISIAGESVLESIAPNKDYWYGPYETQREVVATISTGSVDVSIGGISSANIDSQNRLLDASGAVALEVGKAQARIAGEVWVRDHGAKLDGVTDDLAAFNAAVTSRPTGARFVIVVDGTAFLSATVTRQGREVEYRFINGASLLPSIEARLEQPTRWTALRGTARNSVAVQPVDTTFASSTVHEYLQVRSTGTGPGYGRRYEYRASSFGAGFSIADGRLSIFNRNAGQDGGQNLTDWVVSISPTVGGAGTTWGQFGVEYNTVNRFADTGFSKVRSALQNWSGCIQVVPESNVFGQGGTPYDVTYGIAICPSSANKPDGKPARQHTGLLIEPRSITPTGRAIYASGESTATAADTPVAGFELDDSWEFGLKTNKATFRNKSGATTNAAVGLGATHVVAWLDSNDAILNGIYSGTGSPEGVVAARVGSTYTRRDGGPGTTFYVKESGTGSTGWVGK